MTGPVIGAVGGLALVLVGGYLISLPLLQHRRHLAAVDLLRTMSPVAVGDLLVRPAGPSDAAAILESLDQDFCDANGWSRDHASAARAQLDTFDPVQLGYVSVCHAVDGSVLGFGALRDVSRRRSRCSIGFWLLPSRRSQGLGPGAFAAVVEAIHRAGIRTISVGTRQSNAAMVTCVSRAGGIEVSRRPARLPDGTRPESIWFELRAAERAPSPVHFAGPAPGGSRSHEESPMTDRSAFSDEQWHTLTDAPVAILLALGLVGEHGPISMMKESAAGAKAIARPLHSGPADQLIAEIVPEAGNKEARHDAKQHKGATPNVVVDGLLDDVAKAVEVLAVLPADEAAQVRQWLMDIGQAVADASKGVKPSEQDVLDRLRTILGL